MKKLCKCRTGGYFRAFCFGKLVLYIPVLCVILQNFLYVCCGHDFATQVYIEDWL